MHKFWCMISLKKTLISAQNLENKQSEFFVPRRSMVLKAVRGKILRTLDLAWRCCAAVPLWHCFLTHCSAGIMIIL